MSQKLFSFSSVDGVVIDKVVISEVKVEMPALTVIDIFYHYMYVDSCNFHKLLKCLEFRQ